MSYSSVAVPWLTIFWMNLRLSLIWVGVPALVVGASVWWATRRARADGMAALARRARIGRLAGIVIGVAAGMVAVWYNQVWLAPTAVGAGYLAGVLAGELVSPSPPAGSLRVASLQARGARQYLPRGSVPVAVGAGLLVMVAPVVLALLPQVSYGPWRPDPYDTRVVLPGGTTSWPPPGLSVPLAVIAGLALLAGGVLMRRVAALPQPMGAGQPGPQERARRNAGRAIAGAVLGIELLAVGALAILAGGGLDVPPSSDADIYLGSRILDWAGLGTALAGLLVWCLLGWWRRGPAGAPEAAADQPVPG
jgi:hypothetical protein